MKKATVKQSGWMSPKKRPPYGKIVIGVVLEDGQLETTPVRLLFTDERGDIWEQIEQHKPFPNIKEAANIVSWFEPPTYKGEHNPKPKKK